MSKCFKTTLLLVLLSCAEIFSQDFILIKKFGIQIESNYNNLRDWSFGIPVVASEPYFRTENEVGLFMHLKIFKRFNMLASFDGRFVNSYMSSRQGNYSGSFSQIIGESYHYWRVHYKSTSIAASLGLEYEIISRKTFDIFLVYANSINYITNQRFRPKYIISTVKNSDGNIELVVLNPSHDRPLDLNDWARKKEYGIGITIENFSLEFLANNTNEEDIQRDWGWGLRLRYILL